MDTNNLTQMSRQAVTDAQAVARRLNHNEVDTWHLLSALLGPGERDHPGPHRQDGAFRERPPARGGPGARAHTQGDGQRRHVQGLRDPGRERRDHARREGGEGAQRRVRERGAPVPVADRHRQTRGHEEALQELRARPVQGDERAQGGPREPEGHDRQPRGHLPGSREIRRGPCRPRKEGEARPRHRPRRRDPAHHPDPLQEDEEQPGPDRGAGSRQDRDRRGTGTEDTAGGRARGPEGTRPCSPSTWGRSSPARSTAASSRSA
jgi:hypothetical protein